MKKALCCLFFFTGSLLCFPQQYGTCDRALEVKSPVLEHIATTPAIDQLCAERNSGGKYFDAEHNVAWFTFVVPEDTTLSLDISPENPGDDLDFLLFKDEEGGAFCSHLGIINNNDPIRTNLSKSTGKTGLSKKAEEKIVPKNGASAYSKAVKVKRGERYYLVVDDRTATGKLSLYIHLDFPGSNQTTKPVIAIEHQSYIDANIIKAPPINRVQKDTTSAPPPPKTVPPASRPTKTMLTIKVIDTLGNPVKAELDINGITPGQITTLETAQDSFALDPLQTVNVNCNALGYVFTQASYIAPDTATRNTVTLVLTKIREGQSIVLKGIQFEEGNAKLLPSSNAPLMNVVEFLRNNSNVKIMIKGYVNDPHGNNSGAAKKLSKQRAEAVRDYLRSNGISVNRMDYKGFGNENMLFPNPVNKEQEQANRRVEVEIK